MTDLSVKESKTLDKGECPDCGSKKFLEGPRGGFSVNVRCESCGAEFNLTPGAFTNERIKK